MYKLAVFDIAGTIVSDNGVVIECFSEAFAEVVPELWAEKQSEFLAFAKKTMGQSKIEVFLQLIGSAPLAQQAADQFQRHYLERLDSVEVFEGIPELFEDLSAAGVSVALNTGFNRDTLDLMMARLGLEGLVAATATQSEAGEGRPSPAMLQHVARQLDITQPAEVAAIGDTRSDIEAAIRFGAGLKIGVLTGEHEASELQSAGADLVLNTAVESREYLLT